MYYYPKENSNSCSHCFRFLTSQASSTVKGVWPALHLLLLCPPPPPMAQQPLVYQGLIVSRLHNHTHTTLGRTPLGEWWTRPRDLYLTTLTRDWHPCLRRDSNPQSQPASGRRPHAWQGDQWDRLFVVLFCTFPHHPSGPMPLFPHTVFALFARCKYWQKNEGCYRKWDFQLAMHVATSKTERNCTDDKRRATSLYLYFSKVLLISFKKRTCETSLCSIFPIMYCLSLPVLLLWMRWRQRTVPNQLIGI